MVLTEESAAGVTIVAIAGRLDTQTVHRFSDRLTELLRSGRPHLLIEASRLNYISSMGFRALLVAAKSAAANGGCLAMCSLTAPVQRVTDTGRPVGHHRYLCVA